jgi:ribonuclease HI
MTKINEIEEALKDASAFELLHLQEMLNAELRSRETPQFSKDDVVTYTDGASRGNPGLAGAGILLYNGEDKLLKEDFQFLGVCTNNEAEYRALLFALEYAKSFTKGVVRCFLDSQLTVRQLNGEYALKSEKLTPLFNEVKNRMRNFEMVTFTHVPREHPKLQLADKLANKGIDHGR